MMKHSQVSWIFALILGLTMIGCGGQQQETSDQQVSTQQAQQSQLFTNLNSAVAVIHSAAGEDVSGAVLFTRTPEGIRVQADISGLSEGEHGFHIHQYGDCTADDLTSAGGHYNPLDMPHAAPDSDERHVGDLGNISAGTDGATYDRVDSHLAFTGESSIIGRAVVIHAGEDDVSSQPSGAAGSRVGCGVIGVANPNTSVSVDG
jgi:Cu-Zn family superoxide dismutase